LAEAILWVTFGGNISKLLFGGNFFKKHLAGTFKKHLAGKFSKTHLAGTFWQEHFGGKFDCLLFFENSTKVQKLNPETPLSLSCPICFNIASYI
jgi:hypothetical protein